MRILTQTVFISLLLLVFAAVAITQPAPGPSYLSGAGFEKAAKKNGVLVRTMRWNWGKPQTGWYLYVPLLKKTFGTTAGPASSEFAAAVGEWQRSKRLRAHGVLDQKTLFAVIKHWQSQRIKPIYEARSESLLTAPIFHFYDPTRSTPLLKVDKQAHRAYMEMVGAAKKDLRASGFFDEADSLFLKIISSYRSPAYQAELRRRKPGANRAQIAYRSPHFTGRALDIYVGGEPVSTHDANRAIQIKTPAYQWLVVNAERFGFYPYFYEPWHWEYVGH